MDSVIRTSKKLTKMLRHSDIPDSAGWVSFSTLSKTDKSLLVSPEIIEHINQTSDKVRFELSPDRTKVRAIQGHSATHINPALISTTKIESLSGLKQLIGLEEYEDLFVIHCTYAKFRHSILENGLRRGNRHHIHFTFVVPTRPEYKLKGRAGVRTSTDTYIQIDLNRAIERGYEFWLSINQVILCSGKENGTITSDLVSVFN